MNPITKYFTHVERPKTIRQYDGVDWKSVVQYFVKYTVIGFVFLGLEFLIGAVYFNYPNYADDMYLMLGINAILWFCVAFMFVIPRVVAAVVTNQTNRPSNGFALVFGFLLAGLLFGAIIDWGWGGYMIFAQVLLLLANVFPHLQFTIKWYHVPYFMGLGALACYISVLYTLHFMDVWAYLQCMITCTLMVMIIGNKIKQWGDFYFIGYLIFSVYVLVEMDRMMGFAYFMGAGFATLGALLLFKAWRKIANKAQLREPAVAVSQK